MKLFAASLLTLAMTLAPLAGARAAELKILAGGPMTASLNAPAPKTWIDPDTGLTCHDILNGFGSECSNF
jgi:hypothetical protein